MKIPLLQQACHFPRLLIVVFFYAVNMTPAWAGIDNLNVKPIDGLPVDLFLTTERVDVTVKGTVTDSSGEPIPGVTISIPGTGIGTATDLDGNYSLTVPEGSILYRI